MPVIDPFLLRPRSNAFGQLDDEESLLREIGGLGLRTGASGLQLLGETLDKPGRAIRETLGGNPLGFLNLIPFSDTLGITDPRNAPSGRDLLESAGILGRNKEGFDFGDVLGFGAEVLLDPLTFATFGASALKQRGKGR